jgi:hypothetical protein
MDISNIFINIENKHFFDTDFYSFINIGSYSKQILRNEIQRQFDDYYSIHLKNKSPFDYDYPFINYVTYVSDKNDGNDSNDENNKKESPNPLEHCLINYYIYPKDGTSFLNYYHTSGIIKYLMAIGFKVDFDEIRIIVEKITSTNIFELDKYSNYIGFYQNCKNQA